MEPMKALDVEKEFPKIVGRDRIRKAEEFTDSGDYPGALKVYHGLLDQQELLSRLEVFEIHKNMGNIYLKCGDAESAEESYHRASTIDSTNPNLLVNYGVLAIHQGRFAEAKKRFVEVLSGDQEQDLAWSGMALVHRAHGDFDLSRGCIMRALDENPSNKMALTTYKQWCEEEEIPVNLEVFENYLSKIPEDEDVINLFNRYRKL